MTDTAGSVPPFPGFPGFPSAEMLDRMWRMMRLTPFGSVFPGAEPGVAQGFGPSLSMMSDMMAPLTNVEELDKRITDMRAVEQWLKLNLNMLQSAIQALEVQRATLATLRAFGAFAGAQMAPPPATAPLPGDDRSAQKTAPRTSGTQAADDTRAGAEGPESPPGAQTPAFDATAWWNLLQSQFNQLAQFAMAQPAAAAQGMAQAAASAAADGKPAAPGTKRADADPPAGAGERATKHASSRSSPPRAAKKKTPTPE